MWFVFKGVSIWNAVILFEGREQHQTTQETLVRVRHVAADCMFMSNTVLGGVSARYNIDQLSLLRFYTNCGRKYAKDADDLEMADVCFSKAADFVDSVLKDDGVVSNDTTVVSRAMFDLLLGRAECAWEKEDNDQAELFVTEARKYLDELPGEHEFLASVEYNFGLYTYQSKKTERALEWLNRSIETRGSEANISSDDNKQACTMRLAGICLLALQKYDDSWQMMKKAQDLYNDPSGTYLLLKLSVITKKSNAVDLLISTVEDENASLEVCNGSIALFGDAQRLMDAAMGYRHLTPRFKDDAKAMVCIIGPRYFETLAALGRLAEALEVLETCCALIPKVPSLSREAIEGDDVEPDASANSESVQFSRWAAMCLAAGCEHADRSDFNAAAVLLSRALKVAKMCCNKNPSSSNDALVTPNVVLESEAAVCRFASSCALCSIEDASKLQRVGLDGAIDPTKDAQYQERRSKMLTLAVELAERAKQLDSGDFTARLLLFRAHVLSNEFDKAARELQNASGEIRSFDAGALAEAACTAREVGSTECVIAALQCILRLDENALHSNAETTDVDMPRGFYGAVFVSCVRIFKSGMVEEAGDDDIDIEGEGPSPRDSSNEKREKLIRILQAGADGLKGLGMEKAFGANEQGHGLDEIGYLANIAWNEGRVAGKDNDHKSWEAFFEVCYDLCEHLIGTIETIQMRRMSKLMCACANVENLQSTEVEFLKAKQQISTAREQSALLQDMAPSPEEDPIEGLLLVLEARCNIGIADMSGLESVITSALKKDMSGGTLEQLAAVTNSWRGEGEKGSEERVVCTNLTVALLAQAVDVRLREKHVDVEAVSVTMREWIGLELARKSTSGRAYTAFRKAVDVVIERAADFPEQERRWLVAVGWDRGQMLVQIGRPFEAKRWLQVVARLVDNSTALSSYKPRIDSSLAQLPNCESGLSKDIG